MSASFRRFPFVSQRVNVRRIRPSWRGLPNSRQAFGPPETNLKYPDIIRTVVELDPARRQDWCVRISVPEDQRRVGLKFC
jgi:hypothetical protein